MANVSLLTMLAIKLRFSILNLGTHVKKVKVQVYSLISSISSDIYILLPSHWTCLFVCHLNSTESMQSCSHFGALNLSYTLPSLSYHVLFFTWVKWSIWRLSALLKDKTSKKYVPILRGEKHDIFLKILHQAGSETSRQTVTLTNLSALTIAPCPSLCVYVILQLKKSQKAYKRIYDIMIYQWRIQKGWGLGGGGVMTITFRIPSYPKIGFSKPSIWSAIFCRVEP